MWCAYIICLRQFYLPSRCVIRNVLDTSAHASAAISQYYSHMSVTREMRVSRISFFLVSVLLVLPNAQTQHFIRQFERFANVIAFDEFSFDVDRLINDRRMIVSHLCFVGDIGISAYQRHTQLTLDHVRSRLSTGRTRVRRRIRNKAVA